MKHGTMSLRDRAAAWAFALFSAAALLAVAAQVFLGARPLQGMLPPGPGHGVLCIPLPRGYGQVHSGGERPGPGPGGAAGGLAGALSGHPL